MENKTASSKIVYISWAPYCSRSDNTARELGGKSYMVYFDFLGSNYFTILLKYLAQMIQTLSILLRDGPDVVFVMSPSVFATIPVYLHCKVFGARYVIDAHTGAFDHPMWQKVMFLQKFFCRNALLSIITNRGIAKILEGWGAKYLIIPDVPIQCEAARLPDLKGKNNVTLVNTFASDEPILQFLDATKKLPEVQFSVTGKLGKKQRTYSEFKLDNVHFTDFLPEEDYAGLLQASDLIVVLTTRDHTMQRGAYEAIYYGKPVVTSNWAVLRENFPKGAVFVDNSVEGIVRGIEVALSNLEKLEVDAKALRQEKLDVFKKNKTQLWKRIHLRKCD